MFKLFSKKKNPATEVLVAESTTLKSQYPKEVEAIHNEFFTAGDRILHEADCLLKELEEKDLTKGKRLAALGFSKTREAVIAIETENKLTTTKEIADLVFKYRIKYPDNKFITEEQVKQICEKYGLVCGKISLYNGFIPENKIALMEAIKSKKEFNEDIYEYGSLRLTYSRWAKMCGESHADTVKKENRVINGFQICAPLKDMEITTRQQVVGYKIQDIPDPVVLQPVEGGYLIVCAWGDEASDEIVVNEINN